MYCWLFFNKKCSKDKNMNTFLSIAYKSSIELTLTFRNDPSENVIDVWLEIEIDEAGHRGSRLQSHCLKGRDKRIKSLSLFSAI